MAPAVNRTPVGAPVAMMVHYLPPSTVGAIQELIEHGGLGKVVGITHVPVYRFPQAVGQ